MKQVVWVVLIIDLLLVNAAAGYLIWAKKESKEVKSEPNTNYLVECKALVDQQIAALPSPSCSCQIPSPVVIKSSLPKTKSTVYIPVNGSGLVLSTKWTDVTGTEFYFNPDDYPGLKEAYFEANIRLLNGNGASFARLFDSTVGIEVWGSEVSATGQVSASVVSGKLTLRSGNHLYKVQAKSLTADTTVYNGGRIKLVVEK